jgi:squalene synthase HpnC
MAVIQVLTVEFPSGKDASYENFPVGSWLLPANLRPHIAVFYNFARAIDDIADSGGLASDAKVARLDAFKKVILGGPAGQPGLEKADIMMRCLAATGIAPQHCLDLIAAFKQDAVKSRYRNWDELLEYCRLSAAPVGRFLVDLHGGSRDGYSPSDSLCMALQVINHLQDFKDDYRALDRVYLPQDWMAEAGARIEDLDGQSMQPPLRQVIDRCLDATAVLLADGGTLPDGLTSRRLAMESAGIVNIALTLVAKLRRNDPLARRVVLSKLGYAGCILLGIIQFLLRR